MRIIELEKIQYPEYRTFECCNCSYKADVVGFAHTDIYGTFETISCNNCKILIDTKTEELIDNVDTLLFFNPITPVCSLCNEANNELWDIQTANCPKCDSKMLVTRLIIKPNDDNMDNIKII